jgi:hypothetical protein
MSSTNTEPAANDGQLDLLRDTLAGADELLRLASHQADEIDLCLRYAVDIARDAIQTALRDADDIEPGEVAP